MENLPVYKKAETKVSRLQSVLRFIFSRKYYLNVIRTINTHNYEATSEIHRSRKSAEKHKKRIESTMSFVWVEIISFRSRKNY